LIGIKNEKANLELLQRPESLMPAHMFPDRTRSFSVRNLTVRFAVSPGACRIQNEMDSQREQDQDHQVEQFGFVYHKYLPR
jgi:hypothetical protein